MRRRASSEASGKTTNGSVVERDGASKRRDSIVYVLPGKMGGVVTSLLHLQAACDPSAFSQRMILTYNPLDRDTPFDAQTAENERSRFVHTLPLENVHSVLRRLGRLVPRGGGVLVANDWLELALVSRRGTDRAVIQVLHGDFDHYYDLAVRHEVDVDAFIACSKTIRDKLVDLLPARESSIHHISHGVSIPAAKRRAGTGPLRVVFAGRLEQGQKRVFDLVRMDECLRDKGVTIAWTIIGGGPDGEELRARWKGGKVHWAGVLSNAETVDLMVEQDVFILPSRAEGLPVALLEAMSVGLVPVASNVASGIAEVVIPDASGLLAPVGDVRAFCEMLLTLHDDRSRLERMSEGARRRIVEHYDVRRQAAEYQRLYASWRALRRPRRVGTCFPYGSRLDQPWIPNAVVRFIRRRTRPDLSARLDSPAR